MTVVEGRTREVTGYDFPYLCDVGIAGPMNQPPALAAANATATKKCRSLHLRHALRW